MANNYLLEFGTQLQKTYTDSTKGVAFEDSVWSNATQGNSAIRKTGIIPGTAPSSIALNTALRQAAFGAKIIGDILSTTSIPDLNTNVSADTNDLLGTSTQLSRKLIDYISKINELITGTQKAYISRTAQAYAAGGTIDTKLTQLTNNYQTLNSAVGDTKKQVGDDLIEFRNAVTLGNSISVYQAKNYVTGGNIETTIADLRKRVYTIEQEVRTWFEIPLLYSTGQNTYTQNGLKVFLDINGWLKLDLEKSHLYFSGRFLYGRIVLQGEGAGSIFDYNKEKDWITVACEQITYPIAGKANMDDIKYSHTIGTYTSGGKQYQINGDVRVIAPKYIGLSYNAPYNGFTVAATRTKSLSEGVLNISTHYLDLPILIDTVRDYWSDEL